MALDSLNNWASGAFEGMETENDTLKLSPGSRQEDWEEFINMRLQDDGAYKFWKRRGGSTSQISVTGNIITIYSFTTTISGAQTDYVAIHTDSGHAYLWEKGSGAATQIANSVFTGSQQITFLANGTFLYLFDFDQEQYKVYNIVTGNLSDWMGTLGDSITSYSWITGNFTEDNIWGFEKNAGIGVFHKYYNGSYEDPETGERTFRSFRTSIDKVYDGYLVYEDPSGSQRQTNDGMVSLFPDSADLSDLIDQFSSLKFSQEKPRGIIEPVVLDGGNDHKFSVKVDGTVVPEEGTLTALSSDALSDIASTIEIALKGNDRITNDYVISRSGASVFVNAKTAGSQFEDRPIEVLYHDDPSTFDIKATDTFLDKGPIQNGEFEEPVAYRGYMVLDLLSDGSFAMPGRPITVRTRLSEIQGSKRIGVQLNVPAASSSVEKRFLYATRWQTSFDNVYDPSRPEYPNGAWHLARQINKSETAFEDYTPDQKLTQPLIGDLPLAGGVYDFFGPEQLDPRSIDNMDGTLMIGGYSVNRPIPASYTDPANPGGGNCFVDILSGTDLPENYQIGFIFEYPDGKKSDLELSGQNLTDGTETVESSTSDTQATAETVLRGNLSSTSTGQLKTEYDGNSVTTSFDTSLANEDTLTEVAQKHRDDINADGNIGVDVALNIISSSEIEFIYTARTAGTAENGKAVQCSPPGVGDYYFDPSYDEMSGGEDGQSATTRSANHVHIHSLNTLVKKIYIVAKEGTNNTYRLLREVEISDPGAQGKTLLLPNSSADVQAKESFSMPSANDKQETQDLFDWILPANPFQQPVISEQAKIEGQARIKQIIPLQYDPDKTQMRYQAVVFTGQNVQIGYFSFGESGIDASFEIIGQGIELKHPFGAWLVGGVVVFQSKAGIHLLNQKDYPVIISKDQYDVLDSDLQKVVYNRRWGEYWLILSGATSKVLAYDPKEESLRSFLYPGSLGSLQSGDYIVDQMALGFGDTLYYTDQEGQHTDAGTEIEGQMITRHLGNPKIQTKLLEVNVAGQGYDCEPVMDLQKSRLEGDPSSWSDQFSEDFTPGKKTLSMARASYQYHKRAVMPKLKFKITGNVAGFVSLIDIKYIETRNTGKARST